MKYWHNSSLERGADCVGVSPTPLKHCVWQKETMQIETDLALLADFAQQREDDNWEFRCFLKQSDIPSSEIDSQVHRLLKTVSQQIDCTACANCCKTITPTFKPSDIQRIAKHLSLSNDDFTAKFLHEDRDVGGLTFRTKPCPFVKNNICTVYQHRPRDCRSFPHLQKPGFVFGVTQAFNNYSICPIVFNVYEELKRSLCHSHIKEKEHRTRRCR